MKKILALILTLNANAAPLDWCQTNETPLPMPGSSIIAGQRYIGAVPNKSNVKHLNGPATLDQSDTKYILDNDFVADGNAFTITASNVVLDLNKHKVIYGNKDGSGVGVSVTAWNKVGIEIYNGDIIQGLGKCQGDVSGKGCNPILGGTSSISKVAGIKAVYNNPDVAGIWNYYGTITVQDSTIEDNGTVITNRHQGYGALHLEKASATVFRNKVKARHRGISIGSNSKVYQNIIDVQAHATNAAGVFAFNINNFEIYGNQITGSGEHPLAVFVGAVSSNGKVYSNSMTVENTWKSAEYGNTGSSCFRSTWGATNIDVSCNQCQLHGGNYKGNVGTDPWYGDVSFGRAFWVGIGAGDVMKVHHNYVETYNDNGSAYVPALALVGGYNSAGLEVSDNIFAGSGILLSLGDSYGSATGFPLIARNRFIKTGGNSPMSFNIRSLYGGQVVSANLVDNEFSEPLSPLNVKLDPCNTGSVDVKIKDKASAYLLSDSGTGELYSECLFKRAQ